MILYFFQVFGKQIQVVMYHDINYSNFMDDFWFLKMWNI